MEFVKYPWNLKSRETYYKQWKDAEKIGFYHFGSVIIIEEGIPKGLWVGISWPVHVLALVLCCLRAHRDFGRVCDVFISLRSSPAGND